MNLERRIYTWMLEQDKPVMVADIVGMIGDDESSYSIYSTLSTMLDRGILTWTHKKIGENMSQTMIIIDG